MGSGTEGAASAASDSAVYSSPTLVQQMGNALDTSGNTASGFSLNAGQMGPTMEAANATTNTPSYMAMTSSDATQVPQGSMISRFMQGQNQDLGQAYENFGNNPETYGYLFNKVYTVGKGLGGSGGQQQAAPITINTNYQQETDNPYLRKYRRY